MTKQSVTATVIALAMTWSLAGCVVRNESKDGKDDVDVRTPLGAFAVKTDSTAVLGKIGLPQYPGSALVKKSGSDKDSADVDMSFGSFHLRVLALSLQSSDNAAKIEAFYRNALSQYSDVIACRDKKPVGTPTRTGLGLTCKEDDHDARRGSVHTINTGDAGQLELKAGSASRQHIVSLESRDGGTRIGLVALDLPHEDK